MSASRRNLLRGGAAVALGIPAVVPVLASSNPDADLISLCQRFAAEQLAAWYRWRITEDDAADAEASDFATAALIAQTPATTPEGWQAKALASVAWERNAYDMVDDAGPAAALLSSVLHDLVQPARDAMLARLAVEYGPLPVEPEPEPVAPRVDPDAALTQLCATYLDLEQQLNAHPAARVLEPPADMLADQDALIEQQAAVLDWLVLLPGRTVAGRQIKARVLRAQLGNRTRPTPDDDDALVWSVLCDTLGEEAWPSMKGGAT